MVAMGETQTDWTTGRLAEAAGVSDAYIRRLLIDKRIRGKKIADRVWLVPHHEAVRWLEERENKQRYYPRHGG